MTENEHYYFNEGYERALTAVKKHIEILMQSNSDKCLLIAINLFVDVLLHTRRTSDYIEEKIIEKMKSDK